MDFNKNNKLSHPKKHLAKFCVAALLPNIDK